MRPRAEMIDAVRQALQSKDVRLDESDLGLHVTYPLDTGESLYFVLSWEQLNYAWDIEGMVEAEVFQQMFPDAPLPHEAYALLAALAIASGRREMRPRAEMMDCPICGRVYHGDHGCGTAILTGSAYAEHIMSGCSVSPAWQGARIDGGLFVPNDSMRYPSWECPANAGMCPICWHRRNPDRERTIAKGWVKEAMASGRGGWR